MAVKEVKCYCTNGKKPGMIFNGDRKWQICPVCSGTKKRKEIVPHPSHSMPRKWGSTILAPCGTPRFYAVRKCRNCGLEEYRSNAGHFLGDLLRPCNGGERPNGRHG